MTDYMDAHKDTYGVEMLLSVSCGHFSPFQHAEEVSGEVALEGAHGFALGLALATRRSM